MVFVKILYSGIDIYKTVFIFVNLKSKSTLMICNNCSRYMHRVGSMFTCDCGHYLIRYVIGGIKDITSEWMEKRKALGNQPNASDSWIITPKSKP